LGSETGELAPVLRERFPVLETYQYYNGNKIISDDTIRYYGELYQKYFQTIVLEYKEDSSGKIQCHGIFAGGERNTM
jgi:hypothetical protein